MADENAYTVFCDATGDLERTWTTNMADESINIIIPGHESDEQQGASPEHLFAAAILNCFAATYKVVAKNSDVTFHSFEGSCTVWVEEENNVRKITRGELDIVIKGANDDKRAQDVAMKSKKHCFVQNSITTHVELFLRTE